VRALTLNFQNGDLQIVDLPTPRVSRRSILVANHHSLISSGTEGYVIGMARKGPIGKAQDRPDLAMQVINKALTEGIWQTAQIVRNLVSAPLPLGYSSSGVVLERGADADLFQPGDRVACAGLGQANHAEHIVVPMTMASKLPAEVSTAEGAFGTLGAIALHAVRLAEPRIGETVAVIGLGLLGQLAVQILNANGCRTVGFDIDESKVRMALAHGLDAGGVVGRDDPKELVLSRSGGFGADAVLIAAHGKSNDPLLLAADLARERGRVIALGLVNLDVPRRTFFEKEIRLEVSRAYGAGAYDSDYERKGVDYPYGYVRWTQGRNLGAFIDLVARRKVDVLPLVTHRFPLDRAADAYAIALGDRKEPHVAVLFEYGAAATQPTRTVPMAARAAAADRPDPLRFGVIGAGRFAQAILLPALAAQAGVRIAAIATAQGLTARHVANKYASAVCTSDYRDVLARPDVGSVLVATRHASHAEIVCAAMAAGKHVFVEKPLAITDAQLDEVVGAHRGYAGTLTVGFNRRYSPLCRQVAARLQGRRQPLALTFRFITPRIGKGHESEWVHDLDSGGGRIVGEMCHMVDTCAFLVGSRVATVYARSIGGDAPATRNYDTLFATLAYDDGSIATLAYLANGDASVPQERVELHWEGAYALIDNFKTGFFSRKGKRTRSFGLSQQKGWKEEIVAFVDSLRRGAAAPIPFESLVETTRVTFAIERSLETGEVVRL
jgi:predicted dehydrogenase/threonine dehydrogenase-like Zn-dependent dehydrogenase